MLTIGRSLKKDDFVVILFFVRIAKNTILIESISAKANFMLNIKKVATVLSSIHTERRGGGGVVNVVSCQLIRAYFVFQTFCWPYFCIENILINMPNVLVKNCHRL